MKIGKKQRLAILERAYDKAAKLLPGGVVNLAEMERSMLQSCIAWSSHLSHERRTEYRSSVWRHYGWDQPAESERYQKMLEEIRNGQRV